MGWLIFIDILLIIVLALMLSVTVNVHLNDETRIKIKYAGITIFSVSPEDEKQKKQKQKKQKQHTDNKRSLFQQMTRNLLKKQIKTTLTSPARTALQKKRVKSKKMQTTTMAVFCQSSG